MIVEANRIKGAYRELMQAAKHTISATDNVKIRRAFDLAQEACGDRTILTGEPEILHALSVARILCLTGEIFIKIKRRRGGQAP